MILFHNFQILKKNSFKRDNRAFIFVLELGEEAKVIYEDFIKFILALEEQYETIISANNKGLTHDFFYDGVFYELQKLGADKVYFIKDTFTPELAIPEKATIDNYLKTVQQNATCFEVIL